MYYVYMPPGETPIFPFTLTDLRLMHTNVTWSPYIDDQAAAEFYCYPVVETEQPAAPAGQHAVRIHPELIDGIWYEVWEVQDYTAENIASQWSSIRSIRNQMLKDSDWTQIQDVPVDTASWAIYRQALRDITTQEYPFNIEWPKSPDEMDSE